MAAEPEADPLKKWLTSLARFERDLDPDTLVFPAHNTPFKGVRERLRYLIEHHEDHLQAVEEACVEPKTAVEMLPVLFSRELDLTQMNMALGEAIAHLNYLVAEGRLSRARNEKGVDYYSATDGSVVERAGRDHHKDSMPLQV